MCFNEEYVGQFVFLPNELITNSFNILIRIEAYADIERKIEAMTRAFLHQQLEERMGANDGLLQLQLSRSRNFKLYR